MKLKFANLYNKVLINIKLNIFDNDEIYGKLCNLYEDKPENNELLIETIKEYDFQLENWGERYFINTLLVKLVDNNLLGKGVSSKIKKLIYQKINEMLGIGEIKGEYLEFSVFFRLSPKKEDVIKIEEGFDLIHYLYGYFLRYYFSKKDYDKFCKSLETYLHKYSIDVDSDKFFVLGDDDYESWFKIKKIANTFLEYFINHFDELLNLIYNYKIYSSSIELLCKNASKDIVKNFLNLLFNEYFNKHNYNLESHIKGEKFEKMVESQNDDFDFGKYIFDKISSGEFQAFDMGFYALKGIITFNNISQFFSYNWDDYIILNLYYLYDEADIIGKKIYKKYKKIIDNNKKINDERRVRENNNKLKKEKEIKDKIKGLMEKDIEDVKLQKKKYPCREIVYLYSEYPDFFSKNEIEFVKNEIEFYFSCDEIKLRDSKTEVVILQNNSFRIPRFIRDLVLCVSIHERLGINISKHTDILIGLIPYLFDSELNLILNNLLKYEIDELGEKDVKWLIDIYLDKRQKDLGKFQNTRIPFLISKGFININELDNKQQKEIYQIYKNKLNDENVSYWEKKIFLDSILEIGTFDKERIHEEYKSISQEFMEYNYYEDYLLGTIDVALIEDYEKFLKFNEILISLYKDENCIKWRLKQLKGIKTNYIWKGGEVRGFTKRDDEIFWSNSKDERFYMCLIKVIKYPQYIEDVKKILLNIQKIEFNEEDYMRGYIYDFCLEYFKTASSDEQLEEALLINDEIFVKRYLLKIMDKDYKEEYRTQELQNLCIGISKKNNIDKNLGKKIGELFKENEKLRKKNEKLNKEIGEKTIEVDKLRQSIRGDRQNNSIEIILYVEGKTDKLYIEKAWRFLSRLGASNLEGLNISIINCAGVNNIPMILNSYIINEKEGIHIGLFDIDSGGIRAWANKNFDQYGLRKGLWKCDVKGNIFENRYKKMDKYLYSFILLPYVEEFKGQIFVENSENTFENDEKDPISYIKNRNVIYNDFSSSVFTIENLLYCEQISNFFETKLSFGNKKIIRIKDKEQLYEYIKNGNQMPDDIRDNFLPIFQYIKKVYDEFKDNFNKNIEE